MQKRSYWSCALCATICLNIAANCASQPLGLPRKSGPTANKDEVYPGVLVQYDAIRDSAGHKLRLIVTRPQMARARVPVIFVVGWLSCDSVEAPIGTADASQLVFQAVAKLPGFASVRMEKAGVGDSEGDCRATDFSAELAAYQQAFHKLRDYTFVDSSRIFLFGFSNGGGFAPLVADGYPVRGYVVVGGWIKTWYEHMLEIERRRLTLAGRPPSQINDLMKSVEQLYTAYLLNRQPPQQIFEQRPDLRSLWDGDPDQQYGRPVAYYQQLQDLNLMAAWSTVKVPVLAMHGEFDWIMTRSDLEMIVGLVNRNTPAAAEFVELPATGHTFEHYASQDAAFAGKALPFDERISRRIGDWFERHR